MDKQEYISRLANELAKYDCPNKYDILADYEQIIDEILLDNADDFNSVIDKLGYPEILALDIANEFNFNRTETPKDAKKVKHNDNNIHTKRQKSNIIWNIILAFGCFFQCLFALMLVALTSLIFYFGFNSTVKVTNNIIKDSYVQSSVSVCKEKHCNTYKVTLPYNYKNYPKNDVTVESCQDNKCVVSNNPFVDFSFPLGYTLIITDAVIIIIMWLNGIIIRSVRRAIKANNEYNRRRYYE